MKIKNRWRYLKVKGKLRIIFIAAVLIVSIAACSNSEKVIDEEKQETGQDLIDETLYSKGNDSDLEQIQEKDEMPLDEETKKEEVENNNDFDRNLTGAWRRISVIDEGDLSPAGFTYLYFLANGEFWGGFDIDDYTDYMSADIAPIKAYTQNRELNIWDSVINTYLSEGWATSDESNRYSEMKFVYTLEDIQKPSDDSYADETRYYEKYANDKLIIHITGKYQENPTTIKKIDITHVYEKKFPVYRGEWLEASLDGEWQDNMGNQWFFYYEKAGEGYEFKFSMTDARGNEHIGVDYLTSEDTDMPSECKETIKFRFEDFETNYLTFVSSDDQTFCLDDGGNSFILTRN